MPTPSPRPKVYIRRVELESSPVGDIEKAMVAALVQVATLEPDTGVERSTEWTKRVAAMQALRGLVIRWVHEQRGAGVAVEIVVVRHCRRRPGRRRTRPAR